LDLTQIELLVGFPTYLVLWSALGADPVTIWRRRWLVAGLATGVVVAFKLQYVILPGAILLPALVELHRRSDDGASAVRRALGPIALGAVLVQLPAFVYLAMHGLLDDAWHLYFVATVAGASGARGTLSRLVDSVKQTLRAFAPLLALGLLAIVARKRERSYERVVIGTVMWLLAATFAVLVQQFWWTYHFMLVGAPIGVLAAYGLDAFPERWRARGTGARAAAVSVLVVLVAVAIVPGARKAHRLLEHDAGLTTEGRAELAALWSASHAHAPEVLAITKEPDAPGGDIYVFGDPIFELLSGHDQAIAVTGWPLEQHDARMWDRLLEELDAARPGLVFVQDDYDRVLRERAEQVWEWLGREYCPARETVIGTWYAHADSSLCSG
jgi:hypothetical protein